MNNGIKMNNSLQAKVDMLHQQQQATGCGHSEKVYKHLVIDIFEKVGDVELLTSSMIVNSATYAQAKQYAESCIKRNNSYKIVPYADIATLSKFGYQLVCKSEKKFMYKSKQAEKQCGVCYKSDKVTKYAYADESCIDDYMIVLDAEKREKSNSKEDYIQQIALELSPLYETMQDSYIGHENFGKEYVLVDNLSRLSIHVIRYALPENFSYCKEFYKAVKRARATMAQYHRRVDKDVTSIDTLFNTSCFANAFTTRSNTDLYNALHDAVDSAMLSVQQAQVVNYRIFYNDMSWQDIADVMNVTKSTVRTLYDRAMKKLSHEFDENAIIKNAITKLRERCTNYNNARYFDGCKHRDIYKDYNFTSSRNQYTQDVYLM